MANETIRLRLWQIQMSISGKAILFNTMAPGDGGKEVWLPRSQIDHISRDLSLPNGWQPATVTLQLWLAQKHDLG